MGEAAPSGTPPHPSTAHLPTPTPTPSHSGGVERGKMMRIWDYPGFEAKGITSSKALKLFFSTERIGTKCAATCAS